MKVKVEQSYKLLKKGNYHLYTEQFHFLIRMLSNDEKKCKKKILFVYINKMLAMKFIGNFIIFKIQCYETMLERPL